MVLHPTIKKCLQSSSFKRAERSAPGENDTYGDWGCPGYRLSASSRQAQQAAQGKNNLQLGTPQNSIANSSYDAQNSSGVGA